MRLRMYRTIRYFFLRALLLGEAMLALRAILRLSTAREEALAVRFVQGVTDPLILPFKNIFPPIALGKGSEIDTVVVTAMAGYGLVFVFAHWILKTLLHHD